MVIDSPVTGIGLGRFDEVYQEFLTPKDEAALGDRTFFSSYNLYVHVWNEGEILMFTGFLL